VATKRKRKKLRRCQKNRDKKMVQSCLSSIRKSCQDKKGNLLELAIEAAKNKATLGEISNAMEDVFSRYQATQSINTGIYAMEQENETDFKLAQKLTQKFKEKNGRRPRILAAKIGQDGHDRGIKIIATSFSDIGFDVDIAPLFQTPQEIAKQALENDVHMIGISSLAGGHKTLIPRLIQELKNEKREDIMIIAGGVIPEKDHIYLKEKGVQKLFGPGTIVLKAAIEILEELLSL